MVVISEEAAILGRERGDVFGIFLGNSIGVLLQRVKLEFSDVLLTTKWPPRRFFLSL